MSRGVTCDGTDTASRGKMECRLRLSDWCSRGPDVILVTGTPAALAAKNATATIPIVFFHVADPVGAGLVASLSKPSGNITGVSNIQRELTHKRFELLRSAIPGVTRVGGLIDPTSDIAKVLWQDAEIAAQAVRITVVRVDARSGDEIETAFQGIGKVGLQAIGQIGGSTFWVERARMPASLFRTACPPCCSRQTKSRQAV